MADLFKDFNKSHLGIFVDSHNIYILSQAILLDKKYKTWQSSRGPIFDPNEIANLIIENGITPEYHLNLCCKIATYIASVDLVDVFKEVLEAMNIDITYEPNLFSICCMNGATSVMKYLIESGIDIKANNNFALKVACVSPNISSLKAIKLLVEEGESIRFDDDYLLKLTLSAMKSVSKVLKEIFQSRVSYLIVLGCEITCNSNEPFGRALELMDDTTLKFLIGKGLNVNNQDCYSHIDRVIKYYHFISESIIEILIEADIDFSGLNPLTVIKMLQDYDFPLIEKMINRGLDIGSIHRLKVKSNTDKLSKIFFLEDQGFSTEEILYILEQKESMSGKDGGYW